MTDGSAAPADQSRTKPMPPDPIPMPDRRRYCKRADAFVVALQLDLDTDGFTYQKWGGTQTCKPGDWLVSNEGEVYTVDREAFARTYRRVGPGRYVKDTPVWAEVAREDGEVRTLEGVTRYQAGDYLVSNDPEGDDVYAVEKGRFEGMYELDE